MVKALVFLASGFEEVEASTIIDVLRRCNVDVTVAGLHSNLIDGAHEVKFEPDKTIDEVSALDFDAVVCPGGAPGYENLRRSQKVIEMIRQAYDHKKIIAAICAAPAVLSDAGILNGKRCTIYPGMENELLRGGGLPSEDVIVIDDTIITSRGPATALPFALKLAEKLVGTKIAKEVGKQMLVHLVLK